jgi:hypothetical protein
VSLLVVLHFGGILSTVFNYPPPGDRANWLASQLDGRFYRPYLEFLYLAGSYRYYSNKPQPETLLKVFITYADKTTRWVDLPQIGKGGPGLSDLRMLQLVGMVQVTITPDVPDDLLKGRELAGKEFDPPMPDPGDDLSQEYQEPTPAGKRLLRSIARHIARNFPHPDDPDQKVVSMKIYCVVHTLLTPGEFQDGDDPYDQTTLSAYYQGDFDAKGRLKPSCCRVVRVGKEDVEVREDPMLYWLVPIIREKDGSITDYVKLHAEDESPED